MGLLREFQKFAIKGNVVDMAVGVIIGAAFGRIVTSLVNDMIMPVLGAFTGGGSFGDKFLWLGSGDKPATIEAARQSGEAYIAWGPFIQTTLDFLIIAWAVFFMVRAMNHLQELIAAQKPGAPIAPPEDIQLLREIRDALREQR